MYKFEHERNDGKNVTKDWLPLAGNTKRFRKSMEDLSQLKKRLECVLARPGNSRNSSSTCLVKTRHLGMPKRTFEQQLRASESRSVSSSRASENEFRKVSGKRDLVSGSQSSRKSTSSLSSSTGKGKLFMFKKESNGTSSLNFARLNVDDVLHIQTLKDEDYLGRIVLTSSNCNNDVFSREVHFLPGFKFADVQLHLNSSLVNKNRFRQAFKTKNASNNMNTKKLEIRLPSASYLTDFDSNLHRPKKPYFLYRHSKSIK